MSRCTDTCKRPTPAQAHCAAECHRTFGGIRGFDIHRRGGACRDPLLFGYVEYNGIWREPMDHDKVAMFTERVRRKKEE